MQEVPPWWPPALALATGAEARSVRTSRNLGLVVRRYVAERRPDWIKSNGGGANAILVRGGGPIAEHRVQRLRWLPERRLVHGVRIADGSWVANLHAQAGAEERAQADSAAAAAAALAWAQDAPLVLGGDFNTHSPAVGALAHAGGGRIDHVFVRGWTATGPATVLDRGVLSDHAPVLVTLVADRVR